MTFTQSCLFILLFGVVLGCTHKKESELIDENQLGIIDANVKSEDTNLKTKALYGKTQPGESLRIDRAFENAPPLIPHTTDGFLPIKMENNICFSCHLPEKAKESGAVELPATHFTSLRPKMIEVDGVMQFEETKEVTVTDLDKPNHAYFNCTQCHVPVAIIKVDIENLFTPEFREEFGIERSNLKETIKEGIKN